MMMWNKLSVKARYYIISFLNLGVCWGVMALFNVDFLNLIFFLTAFIWHFALLTPGLKDQVLTKHDRYSFLAVAVRINHYLQIFIDPKKIPYASSVIRAISPVLFALLLFLVGGRGNLIFTLLGSLCFEVVYVIVKKKTNALQTDSVTSPLEHINDLDTPPAIPSAEKNHE